MKIGLYSQSARQQIVKIRNEFKLSKAETTEAKIREFRRFLIDSHEKHHQKLLQSSDSFSLSTMRDLIFHVQEHRFTLLQIKDYLDELGLTFCGFEDQQANLNFRKLHGMEANMYDLTLWHQYEETIPEAFAGMYQFWCQKP